jgi:hypothetical protein
MRHHLALLLPLALLACRDGSPTESPTRAPLHVSYLAQAGEPGNDPGCAHHYAPAQMTVTTSWGATTRLEPREGPNATGTVDGPGRPGEHWIYLIDIALCGTTSPLPPRPTRGVFVNGVELQRQLTVDGGTAAAFTLSVSGVVRP